MSKGLIFDIKRGSLHDGPGIRTVVFLKGCPLRCVWCHNPESQHPTTEIMYDAEKCLHCGACCQVCPVRAHDVINGMHEFYRNKCTACGKCTDICPSGALETVGYEANAEDVMKEVLEDKAFYETSCGGLTISGGEPLMQPEFTAELLHMAKRNGIHTCLDTCGYANQEIMESMLNDTDIFLYDVKETDRQKHIRYTGVELGPIFKNLAFLDSQDMPIILRCPIIPGMNDREEHFEQISRLVQMYRNIRKVDILPYHPLGDQKRKRLNPQNMEKFEVKDSYNSNIEKWKTYFEKMLNNI